MQTMVLKKNKLPWIALIILLIGVWAYVTSNPERESASSSKPAPHPSSPSVAHLNSNSNLAAALPQAACNTLQKSYASLEWLKKNQRPDLRFNNIHKKIGTQIYRLRHFFKDGDEGEIETYLVYLEDSLENARIVEKSSYQKGKLYLKIEAQEGQILYREEGLNLGDHLFLHYVNNQLTSAQGIGPSNSKEFVDCRFQQV